MNVMHLPFCLLLSILLMSCSVRRNPEARPLIRFGKSSASMLPRQFALLNWNIYKCRRENFAQTYGDLAKDADLIILQEATTRSQRKTGRSMAFGWQRQGVEFQMVAVLKYEDGYAGVATGSTAMPVEVIPLPSSGHEPCVSFGKSSIVTRYRLAGSRETLLVANTHGLNLAGKAIFSQRPFDQQMQQLHEVLGRHDGPILWAGDFNTHDTAKTLALKTVTDSLRLRRLPVRDSRRLMHSLAGLEIDHVYVRGLHAEAEVPEHHAASDHAPIWVELSLE